LDRPQRRAELIFETPSGKKIMVFTTRPDTAFGATYLVLRAEHPLVDELTAVEQRSAVKAYQREVQSKDIVSRRVGERRSRVSSSVPTPATPRRAKRSPSGSPTTS